MDGRQYRKEVIGYPGLGAPPLSWDETREKFEWLSAPYASVDLRNAIADALRDLERIQIMDLTICSRR
jgi:2-methylcitrate dehydratase